MYSFLLRFRMSKNPTFLFMNYLRLEDVENQLAQHANTDKENLQELVDIVKRRKEVNARMNVRYDSVSLCFVSVLVSAPPFRIPSFSLRFRVTS